MKSLAISLALAVFAEPASAESQPLCNDPSILRTIHESTLPKIVNLVLQQTTEKLKSLDDEYAKEGEQIRNMYDSLVNQRHSAPNSQYSIQTKGKSRTMCGNLK